MLVHGTAADHIPTLLLPGRASPPFFKAALDEVQIALPDAKLVDARAV